MKLTLLAILFSVFALPAEARDSTWFLCNNEKLALNVLEHRGAESKGALELLLIWGGRSMAGSVQGQERELVQEGKASLAGKKAAFVGFVSVDLAKKTARLKGVMKIDGYPSAVDAAMNCKEMDNHN